MRLMPPTYEGLIIAETLFVLILLGLVIRLTRPSPRHLAGALLGAFATFLVVGPLFELVVDRFDLFGYPGSSVFQPLIVYVQAAIAFAMVAVVTWRVVARYGARGLLVMTIGFMVLLPPRDYRLGKLTGWVTFDRGGWSWLVDSIGNGLAVLLPYAVMRIVVAGTNRSSVPSS